MDNDNDNDHSSNQLPVHKALTCPDGQSAWAVALTIGEEKLAQCQTNETMYSAQISCRLK